MPKPYAAKVLETAMWVLKNPGVELRVLAPTEEEAARFSRDVAEEVRRVTEELDRLGKKAPRA